MRKKEEGPCHPEFRGQVFSPFQVKLNKRRGLVKPKAIQFNL